MEVKRQPRTAEANDGKWRCRVRRGGKRNMLTNLPFDSANGISANIPFYVLIDRCIAIPTVRCVGHVRTITPPLIC